MQMFFCNKFYISCSPPHILYYTFLKVFHGSDSDLMWLQRDFGVYMVNLFDTGIAARLLQYGRFSLSYLLQRFVGVSSNKKYQLADWRIRCCSYLVVHVIFNGSIVSLKS